MNGEPAKLRKGLDLVSVVSLGLGTAVGVAIFAVVAPAAGIAGPAMLLSVVLAAIPMFIIAVTYAFMGSAIPVSGASYEWPRRFLHPAVGFMVAWLRLAGSLAALLVLAFVLVNYASMLIPLPIKPTMLALFTAVFAANLVGVNIAARVQTALVVVLVVLFLTFGALGAPHIRAESFTPFAPSGWLGVLAAVPLLISLFFGIEAATEVGEEVREDRTAIPLGIAIALGAAVLLYLLSAAVCIGVLGAPSVAASDRPVLDAASAFLGPWAVPLVAWAAIAAIGTSLNALFMIFSRTLYAMGRASALPSLLARTHPRFGTPHIAIFVAFVCCVLGLLLPTNLTTLFLAVSIPTLLKYASSCLCAVVVAMRHPSIYAQAQFRFGRTLTAAWALLGSLAAIVIAALGWNADWRPYAALAAWGAIGVLYYVAFNGRARAEHAAA